MNNLRVAQALTFAYWVGACLWALFAGPLNGAAFADWYGLYFLDASIFFAIPSTIAVWGIWAATKYIRIGPITFAITGVALAALDIMGSAYYGQKLVQDNERKVKTTYLATRLDWIRDEPLTTIHGPIGVRIRYRITYSLAKPVCEFQGNGDSLTPDRPPGSFIRISSLVVPDTSRGCSAGSYDFTDDFVPDFTPSFLVNRVVATDVKNICMRWRSGESRDVVLGTGPQHLDFVMFFRGVTTHHTSENTYTLKDFYKTALASGAADCAKDPH